MSPSDIPIIINPTAHSAKTRAVIEQIRALQPPPQLVFTEYAGHAQELARQFAQAGAPCVVAAGGDGTVNSVLCGLHHARVTQRPALGILPIGTMNVLAREYQLPRHDLSTAWQRIMAGPERTLDVWLAGEWPFLQMAGLGLDADVVRSTPWSLKKRWGALSYGLTLRRLMKKSLPHFQLTLDDQEPLTAQAVLCGNGTFYGGSVSLFPDARPDDGLLDVLVAHDIDWPLLARLAFDGLRHDSCGYPPRTSRHRVKKITLTSNDTPVPYECDGEFAGESTASSPVTICLADWKVVLRG